MMMQLMPQDVGHGPMDGLYSMSAGDGGNYDAALQGVPRYNNPSPYTMPHLEATPQPPSPLLPSMNLPTDPGAGFVGGARVPIHVEAVPPPYSRSTSPRPGLSPRPSFDATEAAASSASASVPSFVSPRRNATTAVESLAHAHAPGVHGRANMYGTEGGHSSATAHSHYTSAAPTTPFILPEQGFHAAAPSIYTAPSPRGGNCTAPSPRGCGSPWNNPVDLAHSHSFTGGGSMSYAPPCSHHANGSSTSYVPPVVPMTQNDTWGSSSSSSSHTGGAYPAGASQSYSLGGGGGSRTSGNFYSNNSHGPPGGPPGGSFGYGDMGVDRLGHFPGNSFAPDPYSQTAKWPPLFTSATPHHLPGATRSTSPLPSALGGSSSPLPPPPLSFTDPRGPMLPFAVQALSARSQMAAVPGGAPGDVDVKAESAPKTRTAESSEKPQKERLPAPIKPSPQTKVKRTQRSSKGCCGL